MAKKSKYQEMAERLYGDGGIYKEKSRELFGTPSFSSNTDAIKKANEMGLEAYRRKKQKQEEEKAAKEIEKAKKQAAKEERERKKKKDKEKKTGKKETKASKEIENKKNRLKDAGVDPEKKQSKVGKALNLEKDNNLFFDAMDLMGRGGNAVMNVLVGDAKQGKESRKIKKEMEKKLGRKLTQKEKREAFGKAQQKLAKKGELESYTKRAVDGVSGRKKTTGSDVLKEAGMNKGAGRAVAGFGLDVALDPLNLAGGAIGKGITASAKGVGKGLKKIPGSNKVLDGLDEIFSGKRLKKKTLSGGESDELLKLERDMENKRLYMQEKSKNTVAKAIKEADKFDGTAIGREMERPLNRVKTNELSRMPFNVLEDPSDSFKNLLLTDKTPRALSPLEARIQARTTFDTKPILNKELPNKAERTRWADENGIETGQGGASDGFIKEAYRAENRQKMRTVNNVETEVRSIVSRKELPVQQAAKELQKHPSIRSAAQTLIQSNADLRKFAEENGMEIADLEGYMAHYLTKEGRKMMDEAGAAVSDGVAPIGGNKKVLKRELHDSVANINKAKGMEWFNPDAFVSTAGGQHRMINAIVKESVKKQVLGNADFARELPSGRKARKGFEEVTIDGKKYEVTRGAKQVMTNFEKNVTDEGIQKILTGFDKVQNAWKKTALFSVGFHARNYIGNSWNMHLSGMRPDETVKLQIQAMNIMKEANKKLTGRNSKVNDKNLKLYDEFLQQGLKGTGSMADFRVDPADELMSDIRFKGKNFRGKMGHEFAEILQQDTTMGKVAQGADAIFATSRRAGDAADESARLAMFKWARDKGMSPEEAAAKVRETLFDYTELTPAEQQVFKRAMPFYTWMRKNSEFQMKSFMKNPQKFERIKDAMENGYDNSDMDEGIIPDYLKDNMAIPIPGMNRLASLGLPAADLSKMTDPGKMLMDSLSPLAKVPLEMAMNQKTFNGAPIEQFAGEKKNFLGMEMGAKAAYLGEQIAPLRRISDAMQEGAMDNPVDGIAKLLGGDLLKPYDEESFQKQADWEENKRLDDLIKESKQDGKTVRTINEMKKAGVPVDDEGKELQKRLKSLGMDENTRGVLTALQKKVYNNDAEYAALIADALNKQGFPPEVIELVTSNYLDY